VQLEAPASEELTVAIELAAPAPGLAKGEQLAVNASPGGVFERPHVFALHGLARWRRLATGLVEGFFFWHISTASE